MLTLALRKARLHLLRTDAYTRLGLILAGAFGAYSLGANNIGISLLKGGRGIRWRVLGGIGAGWVAAPVIAAVVCFVGLFFLQNVFDQQVFRPVDHVVPLS